MDFDEYKARSAAMVAELRAKAPNIALIMGQTGLTLLKESIYQEGINVDGEKPTYSKKEVYRSSFKGKEINQGGRKYANEKGKKGTWEGLRRAEGLPGGSVRFAHRNRTISSIQVVAQTQNGNSYSVLTGPSDKESTEILIRGLKKYGNFLKLKESQTINVIRQGEEEIGDIVRKYLH